ncbi:MAG: hypothetical protein IPM69_09060 [Ignavibacteria bacterium]|nr:hypothetical protein [Ignavibacteria bacterium]
MKFLDKLLSSEIKRRKWEAIGYTVLISWLLTLLNIFVIGSYGIALFILIPLFIGVSSTFLYGYKNTTSQKVASKITLLTLSAYVAGLLVFAIEGIICIAMVFPLALILTGIGSAVGFVLAEKTIFRPKNIITSMILFIVSIPLMAFVEKDSVPALTSVTTSIEINASPEAVWKNVVEFPELTAPTELIFKSGIAYPTSAKIVGSGVGAIRYCNFNTGRFVEPITVWDSPRLLQFSVEEQPGPMKELSFWDIKAPHLHDYFVSKQGQFTLTAQANGTTRLEGTTWYYHKIAPAFYWEIWSNYIVHSIHQRVLSHIKSNAEHEKQAQSQ